MEPLTMDKLKEVMREIKRLQGSSDSTGLLYPFGGLRIFESNYLPLTHPEEFEADVALTFRERWIEPLLHPVTMPFEPWVKTRRQTLAREVPNKTAYRVGNDIFMTPMMRSEVFRCIGV